jgi:chromosome segregation ATPase
MEASVKLNSPQDDQLFIQLGKVLENDNPSMQLLETTLSQLNEQIKTYENKQNKTNEDTDTQKLLINILTLLTKQNKEQTQEQNKEQTQEQNKEHTQEQTQEQTQEEKEQQEYNNNKLKRMEVIKTSIKDMEMEINIHEDLLKSNKSKLKNKKQKLKNFKPMKTISIINEKRNLENEIAEIDKIISKLHEQNENFKIEILKKKKELSDLQN